MTRQNTPKAKQAKAKGKGKGKAMAPIVAVGFQAVNGIHTHVIATASMGTHRVQKAAIVPKEEAWKAAEELGRAALAELIKQARAARK